MVAGFNASKMEVESQGLEIEVGEMFAVNPFGRFMQWPLPVVNLDSFFGFEFSKPFDSYFSDIL